MPVRPSHLDRAVALGRVHMIDHELRFNPNRRKVKELIEAGAIGNVRHVNVSNVAAAWGDPASRAKGDWWSLASQGGGRLGANGSHQVDLLRWWLGEVAAVDGLMRTVVPDRADKATGEPWRADADDLTQFTLDMKAVRWCRSSSVLSRGMRSTIRRRSLAAKGRSCCTTPSRNCCWLVRGRRSRTFRSRIRTQHCLG